MKSPIDRGTVLITGASAGIGAAIAKLAAPRASRLVLVARRQERLEALATELRSANAGLQVDVEAVDLTDVDALDAMVERVQASGPVDVLFNNAGFGVFGRFVESDWKRIDTMLTLNITALTRLTYLLAGGMAERRRGAIVNVSSGFGLMFIGGYAGYVGTKHYVTGFTECLRSELKSTGVIVTQVCPGPVETEFHEISGSRVDDIPSAAMITAEHAAQQCLKAVDRNKALVIPGALIRIGLTLLLTLPRAVLRLVSDQATKRLPSP